LSSWLGLLHGLDFIFTALFVGSVAFSLWIAPPQQSFRKLHISLLLILLLISSAWFVCLSAEMADSWKIDELLNVVKNTAFGHLWIVKIILLITLLLFRRPFISLLTPALPLFSSLTGHANAQPQHSALFIGLDYIHFLGASIWTGGLVCLVFWLRDRFKNSSSGETGQSYLVVRRFSHFAIASTIAIAVSGLTLAYLYGVRPYAFFSGDYSELVLLKTILFVTTLSLASVNQFIHLRKWNPNFERKFVQGVLRESFFELILIFAALIVAGFLTRTQIP
jgi:putative copper resistance protein D